MEIKIISVVFVVEYEMSWNRFYRKTIACIQRKMGVPGQIKRKDKLKYEHTFNKASKFNVHLTKLIQLLWKDFAPDFLS